MLGRVKRFLDLYIEHRERFEGKLKEEFPTIYFVRTIVTRLLKMLRAALGEDDEKIDEIQLGRELKSHYMLRRDRMPDPFAMRRGFVTTSERNEKVNFQKADTSGE